MRPIYVWKRRCIERTPGIEITTLYNLISLPIEVLTISVFFIVTSIPFPSRYCPWKFKYTILLKNLVTTLENESYGKDDYSNYNKNGKRMKSSRYRKPQNFRKDNLSSKTVANYFLSTTISPSKSITRTTLTKLTIQHSLVPRNRLGNIRNGRYYLGDRFSIVETVINVASKGEKIAKTA